VANEQEKSDKQKDYGAKYQVMTGNVGPWTKGSIFQYSTFERMNDPRLAVGEVDGKPRAVPKGHPANDEGYIDALIGRLLTLQVIALVPDGTQCSPMPIGPGGQVGGTTNTIAQSAQSVIRARQIAAESVGVRPPDGPAPQERVVAKGAGLVPA
jgi:hypothetical protein